MMKQYEVITVDGQVKTNLGRYFANSKEEVIEKVAADKPLFIEDWTPEEQLSFIHEVK